MTPRNHFVTPSDGTFGNFWRMTARWQDTEGTWDRLRWARMRWQEKNGVSPNAEAAAESLGMRAGTYRAYERRPGSSKHIALDHQAAARFAKKFGANWQWLLLGKGTPDTVVHTPAQERVVSAMSGASAEEQERIARAVEALLRTGTHG